VLGSYSDTKFSFLFDRVFQFFDTQLNNNNDDNIWQYTFILNKFYARRYIIHNRNCLVCVGLRFSLNDAQILMPISDI